jgi:acyl carrier protein phosphodiesterase
MNFLAHLYLSGNDPKLMVGNFIGDFVKGRNLRDRFELRIAQGIELHREIDFFTDQHPVVAQSKNRLRPKYRHYSGVIVDVYYDHFLARQWDRFHSQLLPDFADDCYGILQAHSAISPEQVNMMLPYMIKGNWLVNYGQLEGIHRALTGMSRRTPYESKMDEAVFDLKTHYADFEKEFLEFFPALEKFVADWIAHQALA